MSEINEIPQTSALLDGESDILLVATKPSISAKEYADTANVLLTSNHTVAKMTVITTPRQTLTEAVIDPAFLAKQIDASDENVRACNLSIRSCSGAVELARAIAAADEDYVVFSPRTGLIWDQNLIGRIRKEITSFEELGLPWLCLCADGMDIDGNRYCAAFFDYDPSLLPTRGRRLIIQTAGTLIALKMSNFRSLLSRPVAEADIVALTNKMIVLALSQGIGSFFTSGFYPALAEHKNIAAVDPEQHVLTMDLGSILPLARISDLFPSDLSRYHLLRSWIEQLSRVLSTRHTFSFVVRTILKRPHLLRRCLISIDYLRRSLNIRAEVVLASDVAQDRVKVAIDELSSEFPGLNFVFADGSSENGHSRVRNLVAGVKNATGDRVCIIDDDDYYAPYAVSSFLKACEFGCERLVIFDTQIITERWTFSGVKPHKEIQEYGLLFKASSWAVTLRGSNSIPLCGIIYPGAFIRSAILDYEYHFDLSEDFAFHLCIFAHPRRPEIKTVDGVGAYQSHRKNEDNVSVVADRTAWVLDTGNGLFDLLFRQGKTFEVLHDGVATEGPGEIGSRIASLEHELEHVRQAHHNATRTLAGLVARLSRKNP